MILGPFQRTGAVSFFKQRLVKACRAAGASWPCLHCVWWVNVCVYVLRERERELRYTWCVRMLFVRARVLCMQRASCMRACVQVKCGGPACSWLQLFVLACVLVCSCRCMRRGLSLFLSFSIHLSLFALSTSAFAAGPGAHAGSERAFI